MSRYEKNKNMYEFYVGDRTKPYGFNVNTGRFYGIKGSPIKSVPSELTSELRYTWQRESNVLYYISREIGWYGTARAVEHLSNADSIKVLCLLDRLDAISSPIFDSYDISNVVYYCDFLTENFKALSAYIKEKGEKARLCNFASEYAKELWFKTHIFQYTEHFTTAIANSLYRYLRNRHEDYMNSKEIVSLYVYFLSRGIVDYHNGNIDSACAKISEMLDMGEIAEIKVEKSDFFRQYVNIRRNYIINKTAYDAKAFVARQNAHLKALTYENEELVVVIPTTPAELVAEGQAQHNCVGGYANSVIDGRCNIVFIRKKNDPTASYITCEVCNGKINQYLTHHNGHVYDQIAKDFKVEYAKHIAENW